MTVEVDQLVRIDIADIDKVAEMLEVFPGSLHSYPLLYTRKN